MVASLAILTQVSEPLVLLSLLQRVVHKTTPNLESARIILNMEMTRSQLRQYGIRILRAGTGLLCSHSVKSVLASGGKSIVCSSRLYGADFQVLIF